jgi:hypothetical protein
MCRSVEQPVLVSEASDVFLRVEFGRAGRQRYRRDVRRRFKRLRAMPTGLVEDEDGVRAWRDLGGDVVEMKLHRLGVAHRQHQA